MKFVNQTFEDQVVVIDFNEFIDCTFRRCEIRCHGNDFSIVRPIFEEVKFGLSGQANGGLAFLKLLNDLSPKFVEELLGKVGLTITRGGKPN